MTVFDSPGLSGCRTNSRQVDLSHSLNFICHTLISTCCGGPRVGSMGISMVSIFCLKFTLKAHEMASPMFQISTFFRGTCPQTPLACRAFSTQKFKPQNHKLHKTLQNPGSAPDMLFILDKTKCATAPFCFVIDLHCSMLCTTQSKFLWWYQKSAVLFKEQVFKVLLRRLQKDLDVKVSGHLSAVHQPQYLTGGGWHDV